VDWIHVAQNSGQWAGLCIQGNELLGSVKDGELLAG
jgi:hypothetical protein